MANLFKSLGVSLSNYSKDKWILILSIIPIIIGITVFIFVGSYTYNDLLPMGKQYIEQNITSGKMNVVIYYIVAGLLTAALYFVISYTFLLVVSIISSPFNDMISSRVEDVIMGRKVKSIGDTFNSSFKKISHILINETKKVFFILIMTLFAMALGLTQILSVFSIAISALLLSASFLDYSWSRHLFTFKQCMGDIRGNLLGYFLAGLSFLFVVSIPIVNIFAFSFGVNFFTSFFVFNNKENLLSDSESPELEVVVDA